MSSTSSSNSSHHEEEEPSTTTTHPTSPTPPDHCPSSESQPALHDEGEKEEKVGEEPASPAGSLHISWSDSYTKALNAIESLSSILSFIPSSLSSSETPAFSLLHDPDISSQISTLLRHPDSGAGDNNLCRWLYDTFQSSEPDLHLVVLRFLPIIAGAYLSRVALHKPLAGFEAVLLALYAHETTARNGQAITVTIPDLSHSSIYHESKQTPKNTSTELNLAVTSPSLEPYGTVRSTKRARIVGVALELYYSKISQMPVGSKIDFCEFCQIWAGEAAREVLEENVSNEEVKGEDEILPKCGAKEKKVGRIDLPWELVQPSLRILGHCLMSSERKNKELFKVACAACKSLYARALHDINPRALLAAGSLLRLVKMEDDEVDYTEIPQTNMISL